MANIRPWLHLAIAVLAFVFVATACASATAKGAVHVLRADDDVGPVMEQYIDRGISRAEDDDATLVIIELDTPGGLDTSMRAIVQRIERAKVPVVVYVSPAGSRAASAGRSSRWPRTSPRWPRTPPSARPPP